MTEIINEIKKYRNPLNDKSEDALPIIVSGCVATENVNVDDALEKCLLNFSVVYSKA